MTVYNLYLESGPRRKKTMVHVFDLLGCVATGPTTEATLERTPGAIRAYLLFLARHGEPGDPEAAIETAVAQHLTEGIWLGNGDPSLVFEPDLTPVTPAEIGTLTSRLLAMHAELFELINPLVDAQLTEQPPSKGRPIQAILEHILESEVNYMAAFGKLEGLPGAGSIVQKRQGDLLSWMGVVRAREIERLRGLSEEERSEPFIHWKYTRTARKVIRRMLEHQWEHLVELHERLGTPWRS